MNILKQSLSNTTQRPKPSNLKPSSSQMDFSDKKTKEIIKKIAEPFITYKNQHS